MTEDISQNEIDIFLEDLNAAQMDGSVWGFLNKGVGATRNISMLGPSAIDSVSQLGGRAIYHVDRLLERGRSHEEEEFAKALVRNASKLMDSLDYRQDYSVRSVVSGEGSDCCLWWTLSPYIFTELKPKVGEIEAVRSLLKWSLSGKEISDIKTGGANVNLTGLSKYNFAGHQDTFTLGRDPKGPSHQFAKQEAQRLVNTIFSS